jgi:hypothetical protein
MMSRIELEGTAVGWIAEPIYVATLDSILLCPMVCVPWVTFWQKEAKKLSCRRIFNILCHNSVTILTWHELIITFRISRLTLLATNLLDGSLAKKYPGEKKKMKVT